MNTINMSTLQHLNLRVWFILLLFSVCGALSAQAPRYGHTNLGNLLELLPETKVAEAKLKAYADSLSNAGNIKEQVFREAFSKLESDYKAGKLTPLQVQEGQAEMQKQQQELQTFDQKAQQLGAQRRDELLNPILSKMLDAIKEVAKENGYLMVFDTSSGAMLFANEMDDVTPLIRKKLGIQ